MMGWYDTKPGYLQTYIKDYVTLYVKNIRTIVLEVSSWTSLVVQSLRFHASSAGAVCWIPSRGTEILCASQCDQKIFLKSSGVPLCFQMGNNPFCCPEPPGNSKKPAGAP